MTFISSDPRLSKKQLFYRAGFVFILIIAITALHYLTLREEAIRHLVYRELYFLPIILLGLWFGLGGGIIASLLITVLYIPSIPSWSSSALMEHNLGYFLEIVLFNIVGPLVGWLRNREFQLSREKCEAEHLASMGQAVSCIAHDMKTPLTAIGGFIYQARKRLSSPARADERLTLAGKQVKRMERMILDMLAFAKPLNLECKPEPLSDLIRDTVTTVAGKAHHHQIRLQVEIEEDSQTILRCDRHRLQQGLMNLLVNAIEASPPHGVVTIRGLTMKKEVWIEVIDQGKGIPAEERQKILQPFITTKRGGTGLGLPIVNKVITAHAGRLEINNNPPAGTLFRLRLPENMPA
ncbi:MAG TPA: HAMP domain-containing histidine kinase [Desulfobacterales bacterium]|nr:HAMP domain-containing histidine kinase [Desulfobacterales bacterium]